jgi:hypothetical protein
VLIHDQHLVAAVGMENLLYAVACSAADSSAAHSKLLRETERRPARAAYPGWVLQERPASSMQQLVFEWHVSLQDIKVKAEEELEQLEDCKRVHSEQHTHQGTRCYLSLHVQEGDATEDNRAQGKQVTVACVLQLAGCKQQLCRIRYRCLLMKAGSNRNSEAVTDTRCLDGYVGRYTEWIMSAFDSKDAVRSWGDLEQQLRAAGAVHADNCLHIKVIVKELS